MRCCAVRACTRRTSPSGARPATLGPAAAWHQGEGAPVAGAGRGGEAAPARRAARGGAGPHEAGVGDHGKSTRALGAALRERGLRPEVEAVIDEHFDDLEAVTSTSRACTLLGASRATRYRRRRPPVAGPPTPARRHRTHSPRPNASTFWRCCARRSTATWRRPRCGPVCSMTASTCARSPRCTGCWRSPARTGSGAANVRIRRARNPS